jgi:hypothetical protein
MKHTMLLLVLFASLFSACCTYEECEPGHLGLGFPGFDSLELTTVIISKYSANSRFDELKEVKAFTAGYYSIERWNDTFYLSQKYLEVGFDYKIYIESTNTSCLITELRDDGKTEKECGSFCVMCGMGDYNPPCRRTMRSCKQNDNLIVAADGQGLVLRIQK